MRIDIKPIARETGSSVKVSLQFSPDAVDFDAPGAVIGSGIVFSGEVISAADKVMILVGTLHTTITKDCDRCGMPAVESIEGNVEATFRSEMDEKFREFNADPDEEYLYEGFSIVPDRALRDALILNTPTKILCKSDCRGLCPICGANLNEIACNCKPVEIQRDNPFDRLQELL